MCAGDVIWDKWESDLMLCGCFPWKAALASFILGSKRVLSFVCCIVHTRNEIRYGYVHRSLTPVQNTQTIFSDDDLVVVAVIVSVAYMYAFWSFVDNTLC